MHRKDPSEAIPYFRRYAELKPDDYRGPYAIGVALFLAKNYEAARAQLLPFAARKETAAGANYLLARIARAENEDEEALRLAPRAVEADPRSADAYSELGLLYQRLGQTDRAEEALQALPRDRPEPLPRQPAPADAVLADEGPAAGRAAGAVRRAQEAARGAGGRLPSAGRDPAVLKWGQTLNSCIPRLGVGAMHEFKV